MARAPALRPAAPFLLALVLRSATSLAPRPHIDLRFDHVQVFADAVEPIQVYEDAEDAAAAACAAVGETLDAPFDASGRDLAKQLITALQWRV
eukprot:CAMPEP_0119288178 /NCGR_PEP_ID=MMETSP1329-20130426/36775_1 /TAXON_ID=114041 /ORGANISM="Genus nov. species nov., Strain RCC1024" /LENGTH=92 /DNA_ID=CAMNT_0007288959 /DNA_START=22 /DNA_END=297 /DNA_ORIENTATION=-